MDSSLCSEKYGVNSEFDLEQHKKHFVHYLEVMIDEDGIVHYAVPSHQEWAIERACECLGVNRHELCDMTPKEYYGDWLNWLLTQCKGVAVWEEFYMAPEVNKKQYAALRRLKIGGVYKGRLPDKKAMAWP